MEFEKPKEKVLVVETEKKLDVDQLNNRLGGTVKIGKILDKIDSLENFEEKFFDLIKFGNGKVYFGFSLYSLDPKVHLKHLAKKLTAVAMEIKRKLREEKNINSRYVVSKELELSSVIVKKNKLLLNGAEICFLIKEKPSLAKASAFAEATADKSEGKEILVGQTLAVQPFEEFGQRDFTRPNRDELSGMLPPKLARIMVNLAQLKKGVIILDPFCGSGTTLQEALLLGYNNLIASDKNPKAINNTQNNLNWLASKYGLNTNNVQLLTLPIEHLARAIKPSSIDAIITEPYLGPALKGNEGLKQINLIIKELETFYLSAFNVFTKILKSQGKMVIILPIFRYNNSNLKLAILNKIEKLGFKILNKEDLIYFRPNQFIWREILILEKE